MVGTGGAVTVGLDGRTEAREQNSSHPSVGIVGLRHHGGHLLTRLKLEKWGSQKNHKIGTVNERPVKRTISTDLSASRSRAGGEVKIEKRKGPTH